MMFNLPTEAGIHSQRDYVDQWKRGMQEAYAIACENAREILEKQEALK